MTVASIGAAGARPSSVLSPRRIVLAGEVLSDDVTGRTAEAWAIEPFQAYASTEALMLASGSSDRVGLHINSTSTTGRYRPASPATRCLSQASWAVRCR